MNSKDKHSLSRKGPRRTKAFVFAERDRLRPFKQQAANRMAELDSLSNQIMKKWSRQK